MLGSRSEIDLFVNRFRNIDVSGFSSMKNVVDISLFSHFENFFVKWSTTSLSTHASKSLANLQIITIYNNSQTVLSKWSIIFSLVSLHIKNLLTCLSEDQIPDPKRDLKQIIPDPSVADP
jgi:hypothetical protein